MKQKNTVELTCKLFYVSEPLSANYGDLMTQKEVNDFTSNPDYVAEVIAFLVAAGATTIPQRALSECVSASAPVGLWERLLDTEFYTYSADPTDIAGVSSTDLELGKNFVRAEKYSVPFDLDVYVDCVVIINQVPHSSNPKIGVMPVPLATARSSSCFSEEMRLINGCLTPDLVLLQYG